MKCPKCGQPLKPSQKDPDYMLCFNCRKKFRVSGDSQKRKEDDQKYSNIPPKKVRDKREKEMRRAYDELLSVEDERPKRKPKKRPEPVDDYDDYYDDYDDDKVSKMPVIILGIAIIAVAAFIIYMLLK